METRRWTNPSQPQTLYMATFLLYIEAFFNVLTVFDAPAVLRCLAVGQVAGGMGIANEKRGATTWPWAWPPLALLPAAAHRRPVGRRRTCSASR